MTEEQILKWMRDKVKTNNFKDAATLAKGFLEEHEITDTLDPEFNKTMNAGFKIAQEIATL